MIIATTLIIIAISACIFLFILGYFCFSRACVRDKRRDPAASGVIRTEKYGLYEETMKNFLREYESLEKESVYITSFDSLRLCASYIPSRSKTERLIIAFHGYRSFAAADFSPICSKLLERGCSLLLVDQRSHGRSEGRYIGFGALERRDALSWCEYAKERFGEEIKIYLFGVSMGAATVTLASSLELPYEVKGVIADCGFTSPYDIIKNTLRYKNKIPPYPTVLFMNLYSKLLAGYDFCECSSTEEIKKSSLPILIIHGDKDRYVPTEMSQKIYKARPESTTLILTEGATHARSQLVCPELYLDSLVNFFKKCEK